MPGQYQSWLERERRRDRALRLVLFASKALLVGVLVLAVMWLLLVGGPP